MNQQVLLYIMGIVGVAFVGVVIAFVVMRRNNKERKYLRQLQEGTKTSNFSMEIVYQKLYVFFLKTKIFKRYILKLRRRLEILNIDDEYLTRLQAAKILTKSLFIIIPLTIVIIMFTKQNPLLMGIILLFELFLVDTIIDGMVDKMDDRLLEQQINFFQEIRHAYHEYNMVEEAIYQTAQDDDNPEMSRQAEKIYEVLISDDPESELEKYYDIAPNAYLKEFAGVSYLTKEFGDKKVDGASLYLKNLNNITQEMQLEILKRSKLNYVFQSLSIIAIVPMLGLEPIKNWAIGQFGFTRSFYAGKNGLITQMIILFFSFVCYILTKKLKDNGSTGKDTKNTENPWEKKVYDKIRPVKALVDVLKPKDGTKENMKLKKLMKDAASKERIEWIYVRRIFLCIIIFIGATLLFTRLHALQIENVYNEPTVTYNLVGSMDAKQEANGMKLTASDNLYIAEFKDTENLEQSTLEESMKSGKIDEQYISASDSEISAAAERIMDKIQTVNSEYFSWIELLGGLAMALIAYQVPILMLHFQRIIRRLEMEDEVMQFQTIILMLMRIERVNVEMIMEWLERYSNIFRDPISKCVNNYESGPWEALEQMKDEVTYLPFIRICESLQAAVEKIPIKDAFDELDTEREYYQAKRQETNERLISRKGMIGKAIGFAPMVIMFVGYLIVPLIFIGISSMNDTFNSMM